MLICSLSLRARTPLPPSSACAAKLALLGRAASGAKPLARRRWRGKGRRAAELRGRHQEYRALVHAAAAAIPGAAAAAAAAPDEQAKEQQRHPNGDAVKGGRVLANAVARTQGADGAFFRVARLDG